eukprot:84405-Alexandrium_andersonii.AAC.1
MRVAAPADALDTDGSPVWLLAGDGEDYNLEARGAPNMIAFCRASHVASVEVVVQHAIRHGTM